MRLDRFLWWARLTKTRGAAQQLAMDGRLRIDGRPVSRGSANIRVGCVMVWFSRDRVRAIRVQALPARRGPGPEARACYEELALANVSQQLPAD